MHIGWLCAALSAMTLLPPAFAVAATPEPTLRRSEQIDIRRLGKAPEVERSVLRVEWRAAVTGAEEARSVQDMLDRLRHMEETTAEINRLLRSTSAPKPVAAQVAAEPHESGDFNSRLALANLTVAALVAFWWFRRRIPAKPPGTTTASNTAPEGIPPDESSPVAILPTLAPVAEATPAIAPPARTAASNPPAEKKKPALAAVEVTHGEVPPLEPRTVPEAVKTEPFSTPIEKPNLESTAPPDLVDAKPSAAQPIAENNTIDFLLEDADPEVVAREDAKVQQLRAIHPHKPPKRQHESNVEPTLQLAEIMLSMGLEQGAAQALLEYTEANPRQAAYHWLKLLGIYRKQGQHQEFTETAEKLRRHFNIQAEDWTKVGAGEAPRLESFSRVSDHVQQIWPQPAECIPYLQHLLEDNRDGARAGFPQSVAEEILLLIDILKETSGVVQTTGAQRPTT
jgi:hypothetical protein